METEHHFCLVLEHVDGGELYDYVEKLHGSLSAGHALAPKETYEEKVGGGEC